MADGNEPKVALTPGDGALRLQTWFRKFRAERMAAKPRQAWKKQLAEIQSSSGVKMGNKRVQAWSEESAQLALVELNGKVGKNGIIMWPKGTVEKLLIERTKYADMIKESPKWIHVDFMIL